MARKPRRRSARPEQNIQRAVFDHLRTRSVPNVFAFHVPNGGYRKPIEAAIFKGLGVRAGVPDIIAIHAGKVYTMELKALDGRPTLTQLEVASELNRAGAFTATCYGLDMALRQFEEWQLLKGRAG